MKNRSNVNWLVLITFSLLITALSMFYISVKNSLGINKCIYSEENISNGCICNSEGQLICDDGTGGDSQRVMSSEFTAEGMTFSYDFLNYIEDSVALNQGVKFIDITNSGSDLKLTVEKRSLCDYNSVPAPQVGFYKETEDSLIFTIGTNLVESRYSTPCVTEAIFNIVGFRDKYPDGYTVYYQDEFDVLTPANNCVYEGFLRNEGDTYQSLDGCALCTCNQGQNSCELESSCLQ